LNADDHQSLHAYASLLPRSAFFQANCVFSGASTAANERLFIRRGTHNCSDCSAYMDSTDLHLLSPAIDCPIDRSIYMHVLLAIGCSPHKKSTHWPAGSLVFSISVARTLQSSSFEPSSPSWVRVQSGLGLGKFCYLAFPPNTLPKKWPPISPQQ